MSKMTLLEKIKVILDVTKSSNLFIIVILILIALGLGLSMSNPKNQNKQKLTYIMLTIFIMAFSIFSFHTTIGNMFTYMMDNLFIAIFFPNLAVYLAAIIITNIILWISIFSFKSAKPIRNLNIVIYSIITYLMLLLLSVVNQNKLDIFSQESVYSNNQASAIIDISSFVFVLWIIFLITYKVILLYLKKNYAPNVKKVIIKKKVKILPENFQPLNAPDYAYGTLKKNNKSSLVEFENRFTLEDYKLFSKILKEEKTKVVDYISEFKKEKDMVDNSTTNYIEEVPIIEEAKATEDFNNIADVNNTENKEEKNSYQDFINNNEAYIEEPSNGISEDKIFQDYAEFNKVNDIEEYQNPIEEITSLDDKDDAKFFVEKDYSTSEEEQERESSKYTELELLYRGIH